VLSDLNLTNFKSWPELNIEFKPITLLYGPNSSGKSSIIQFLLLLKQTKDSTDFQVAVDFGDAGKLVDLGSFQDTVYKHDKSLEIWWKLAWKSDRELSIIDPSIKSSDPIFSGRDVSIEVNLAARGRQLYIDILSYFLDEASFYIYRKETKPKYQLETENEKGFRFIRSLGRAWDLPEPTKAYSFPDQAQTYFQNAQFLSLFESSYVSQLDRVLYLGPLRDDPRRQYTWTGSYPSDVGTKGERTVEAILAASEREEHRNVRRRSRLRPFQEIIAWWLKELGLIESFEVREISPGAGLYRAFVRKTARSPETLITDVGFGVSQILPVLVLLYYAPEGSTVMIEQPEIHLHPAVQAGLADLFISVCKVRGVQLIIESHSEHLLNRLMRRVAEEETPYGLITNRDIGVYFAENRGGRSHLESLQLTPNGVISNWPKDFFGDQMGEVVAREQASLRKRMRAA
jgi:predicted ATPase